MVVIIRLEMSDKDMKRFKEITGVHPRRKAVDAEVRKLFKNLLGGSTDEEEDEDDEEEERPRKRFRLKG